MTCYLGNHTLWLSHDRNAASPRQLRKSQFCPQKKDQNSKPKNVDVLACWEPQGGLPEWLPGTVVNVRNEGRYDVCWKRDSFEKWQKQCLSKRLKSCFGKRPKLHHISTEVISVSCLKIERCLFRKSFARKESLAILVKSPIQCEQKLKDKDDKSNLPKSRARDQRVSESLSHKKLKKITVFASNEDSLSVFWKASVFGQNSNHKGKSKANRKLAVFSSDSKLGNKNRENCVLYRSKSKNDAYSFDFSKPYTTCSPLKHGQRSVKCIHRLSTQHGWEVCTFWPRGRRSSSTVVGISSLSWPLILTSVVNQWFSGDGYDLPWAIEGGDLSLRGEWDYIDSRGSPGVWEVLLKDRRTVSPVCEPTDIFVYLFTGRVDIRFFLSNSRGQQLLHSVIRCNFRKEMIFGRMEDFLVKDWSDVLKWMPKADHRFDYCFLEKVKPSLNPTWRARLGVTFKC